MIPVDQQEYLDYQRAFRSNYYKGASLFKALIGNPEFQQDLVENAAAMNAVFIDAERSAVDQMCLDILAPRRDLYDAGLDTFLASQGRNPDNLLGILNNLPAILAAEADPLQRLPLEKSTTFVNNAFRKSSTYDAIRKAPWSYQSGVLTSRAPLLNIFKTRQAPGNQCNVQQLITNWLNARSTEYYQVYRGSYLYHKPTNSVIHTFGARKPWENNVSNTSAYTCIISVSLDTKEVKLLSEHMTSIENQNAGNPNSIIQNQYYGPYQGWCMYLAYDKSANQFYEIYQAYKFLYNGSTSYYGYFYRVLELSSTGELTEILPCTQIQRTGGYENNSMRLWPCAIAAGDNKCTVVFPISQEDNGNEKVPCNSLGYLGAVSGQATQYSWQYGYYVVDSQQVSTYAFGHKTVLTATGVSSRFATLQAPSRINIQTSTYPTFTWQQYPACFGYHFPATGSYVWSIAGTYVRRTSSSTYYYTKRWWTAYIVPNDATGDVEVVWKDITRESTSSSFNYNQVQCIPAWISQKQLLLHIITQMPDGSATQYTDFIKVLSSNGNKELTMLDASGANQSYSALIDPYLDGVFIRIGTGNWVRYKDFDTAGEVVTDVMMQALRTLPNAIYPQVTNPTFENFVRYTEDLPNNCLLTPTSYYTTKLPGNAVDTLTKENLI